MNGFGPIRAVWSKIILMPALKLYCICIGQVSPK